MTIEFVFVVLDEMMRHGFWKSAPARGLLDKGLDAVMDWSAQTEYAAYTYSAQYCKAKGWTNLQDKVLDDRKKYGNPAIVDPAYFNFYLPNKTLDFYDE